MTNRNVSLTVEKTPSLRHQQVPRVLALCCASAGGRRAGSLDQPAYNSSNPSHEVGAPGLFSAQRPASECDCASGFWRTDFRRDARTQTLVSNGALLGTLLCVLAYRCVIYWSTVKPLSGWRCSLVCLRTNPAHVTSLLSLLASASLRLFPAPTEHPAVLINTD